MRLFIAEKPSLGRAIADVLPGPQKRFSGHIECADDTVVSWCIGHILEPAPPHHYGEQYKSWNLQTLPILPERWDLLPKNPPVLATLRRLLGAATSVVHAGDPDREGQLLVDEVLDHLGYRGPVERLLITDLNPDAVRRALSRIESNAKYQSLYQAGRARQMADWLVGMNMTRLYTVLGQNAGYDGVLSVGRVQTPLLGIIVRRDLEIESFKPKPYFTLRAKVQTHRGEFTATWVPGEQHASDLDSDKRLLNRTIAVAIQQHTQNAIGTVTAFTEEQKTEPPPLPFSLSELQIQASRRHGYTAQQVLDTCQRLYETHKLITYPRSDCSYLPEGHLAQVDAVLTAISANLRSLAPVIAQTDRSLRSRAWNDKKITAHHAVIPTPRASAGVLTELESHVYELIAQRYTLQFSPAFEYLQTTIDLNLARTHWRARGRRTVTAGWKDLLPTAQPENPERSDDTDLEDLPHVDRGDRAAVLSVAIVDKITTPPKPFTDASLIQAMHNVANFVTDPAIKRTLNEHDGIGTEATRASIIETLFTRNYVRRDKKTIRSTQTGRDLIQNLPATFTTPDITALWEAAISSIASGKDELEAFLRPLRTELQKLVESGKSLQRLNIAGAHACTRPACQGHLRRRKGPTGFFWSCSVCRSTTDDVKGSPANIRTRDGTPSKKPRSTTTSTQTPPRKPKAPPSRSSTSR